jgi:uncharacterized protein (DUF2235 family)
MSKNIVVFSDGTGQEGGEGHNTNVYKLFNMVLDRSQEQVAFYDRGLGTGWRKLTGNAGGRGFSRNVKDCYRFIFENFQAGDQIYLFGFSRGAATVRSLSSFIHLFGILPKSREELIDQAYKIYRTKNPKQRTQKADYFVKKHHTMWTKVRFLGVWDTVAALGVPLKAIDVVIDKIPFWKHQFHNFRLSPSVMSAYHALAIDDERKTFHPRLWKPLPETDERTMKQVWFCGMHTDVGGGYKEQQLSDIVLDWMRQMAVNEGLKIYHDVTLDPQPDGFMHDSRGEGLAKLYRREVRKWNAEKRGRPRIHESVRQRSLNRHNTEEPVYRPWILEQFKEGDYDIEP